VAQAREALGALAGDAAVAAGRAMSTDTMLQEAEAWLQSLPGTLTPAVAVPDITPSRITT
jgi:hypothetical protein